MRCIYSWAVPVKNGADAGSVQVEEMILDDEDKKAHAVFGGRVGEDQIEIVLEKPKKKPAPVIAAQ